MEAIEVVFTQQELELLLARTKANKDSDKDLSDQVKVQLKESPDWKAFRVDISKPAYQFSLYQECNGVSIDLNDLHKVKPSRELAPAQTEEPGLKKEIEAKNMWYKCYMEKCSELDELNRKLESARTVLHSLFPKNNN